MSNLATVTHLRPSQRPVERRVAEVEDGYTRLANALYEELIGADLTKNQSKVAHAICRKTYGYGKKMDRISDNPETVARWLDAMANLERRNAQFNEFKAEWMSANGNPGQSRNGGQILGLDVKKGESLGSAVKRYMSMNTDAAPAQDSTPSGEPRNQVGSYTSKSGIQFTVE
ncbi:replication protein [Escherichia coli]|nr:replication protein [Escherichia coli]EFC6499789.1 hypothetical protein [Escherichia coli]